MGSFKGVLFAILIGLLLVSLTIWGVSDAFKPQTRDAAAMVGKEKISLVEFDRLFQRALSEENKKLPERITTKQAYARGLHNTVLTQVITNRLIKLDADSLGLDVNQRDALQFVEGLEVFNNTVTGKFDGNKLLSQLSRIDRNMSRKQFEEDVFDAIRQEQTISSILTGLATPTEFANQQYKFMTEQRKVNMLVLDRTAITLPDDPSDEDLQTYITENQNQYVAPEYRQTTILRLEPSDIALDIEVSEEEIADQFDYKIKTGQLGNAETRSFLQIIVDTKEIADAVSAALNAGTSLDEVLAQFTLDAPIAYTDVLATATSDPKTGDLAFTMDENSAQTLEGSFGTWYSVYLSGITPATAPSLDTESGTIREEIRAEKSNKVIYDVQKLIQVSLDSGLSLEEAAKEHGVPVASYDYISRIGQNMDGVKLFNNSPTLSISQADDILKEIFTNDIGFEGDLFETIDKGIAAVRVDNVKASASREFSEVKEQALQAWRMEKSNEALEILMTDIAERVQNGANIDEIALEIGTGANIREVEMMRAIRTDGLSPQLAARIFNSSKDSVFRGVAANGIDRIVGKIIDVTSNEDAIIDTVLDTLKQRTAEQLNGDIQIAYRSAILKDNPVRTMSENIQQTLGISDQ
jgi:peptidyl-prolyl cis-trans isomerase D